MTKYSQTFKVETVARFPKSYFLENLVVRADGAVLVTAANKRELWYVPAAIDGELVEPVLIDTLDGSPIGVVEVEPDVFCVCTLGEPPSNGTTCGDGNRASPCGGSVCSPFLPRSRASTAHASTRRASF